MARDITSTADDWVVNWILRTMDQEVRALMRRCWSNCSLMGSLIVILMMQNLWLHQICSPNSITFSGQIWIWISCHHIIPIRLNRSDTCLRRLPVSPSIIHSILNLSMRVSVFLRNPSYHWIQGTACHLLSLVNYRSSSSSSSGVVHLLISGLRHII